MGPILAAATASLNCRMAPCSRGLAVHCRWFLQKICMPSPPMDRHSATALCSPPAMELWAPSLSIAGRTAQALLQRPGPSPAHQPLREFGDAGETAGPVFPVFLPSRMPASQRGDRSEKIPLSPRNPQSPTLGSEEKGRARRCLPALPAPRLLADVEERPPLLLAETREGPFGSEQDGRLRQAPVLAEHPLQVVLAHALGAARQQLPVPRVAGVDQRPQRAAEALAQRLPVRLPRVEVEQPVRPV